MGGKNISRCSVLSWSHSIRVLHGYVNEVITVIFFAGVNEKHPRYCRDGFRAYGNTTVVETVSCVLQRCDTSACLSGL